MGHGTEFEHAERALDAMKAFAAGSRHAQLFVELVQAAGRYAQARSDWQFGRHGSA